MCKKHGVPDKGSRESLIERHKELVLLYNAQLSDPYPKTSQQIARDISIKKSDGIKQNGLRNENIEDTISQQFYTDQNVNIGKKKRKREKEKELEQIEKKNKNLKNGSKQSHYENKENDDVYHDQNNHSNKSRRVSQIGQRVKRRRINEENEDDQQQINESQLDLQPSQENLETLYQNSKLQQNQIEKKPQNLHPSSFEALIKIARMQMAQQQVNNMSEQQVNNMSEQQVNNMSEQQVNNMSEQQVNNMSEQQVNNMSEQQVNNMSEQQVNSMSEQLDIKEDNQFEFDDIQDDSKSLASTSHPQRSHSLSPLKISPMTRFTSLKMRIQSKTN